MNSRISLDCTVQLIDMLSNVSKFMKTSAEFACVISDDENVFYDPESIQR